MVTCAAVDTLIDDALPEGLRIMSYVRDSTSEEGNGRPLPFEDLTYAIIGAFYAVYNALGYGFLESVYRNALVVEMRRRGLRVEQEVPVDVFYLGERVGSFRM